MALLPRGPGRAREGVPLNIPSSLSLPRSRSDEVFSGALFSRLSPLEFVELLYSDCTHCWPRSCSGRGLSEGCVLGLFGRGTLSPPSRYRMPGFDFLAVPGQALPNTYDDWMGLDMNDWNAVFARFTDHYLIVVAQSVLFQAVPSAFGARQAHGSMCASAHIVESLLLQFATATPPAQSFLFADTALSPAALSRIEAHVVALPGFVMPTSDDAHELVRRLAGLHANLSAEDLVTLGADDFIALEPIGQSHISANASWALEVSVIDHQCLCSIQSLSVMGDVAALLGPRAVEHARATPHRQLSRVAVALHAGALEAGDVTVAPDLVLQSIWASQWPPVLKTSIVSPIAAQSDARSRYKYAAGTPDSMTRALSTRLCEVVPAFVTLGEVAMPAHSPAELAARLRSLLTAVDACAQFRPASLPARYGTVGL